MDAIPMWLILKYKAEQYLESEPIFLLVFEYDSRQCLLTAVCGGMPVLFKFVAAKQSGLS